MTTKQIFCSYCHSAGTIKRGFRRNKREKVQLFLCSSCLRTFTPRLTKGKHFPSAAVVGSLNYYNLGFSLKKSCRILKEKTGFEVQPSTLANWVEEYKDLCRFYRYRPFAIKMFSPQDMVETATLAHRQLYRFRFHKAKARLIIREDIKHARFYPLIEFLSSVAGECPHQYFQEGLRASEAPIRFSREEMIVRSKHNYANQLAEFVTQATKKNKDRHEELQKFMLANDSVTVATEVPVYLKRDDLEHMQTQLGFGLYSRVPEIVRSSDNESRKFPRGRGWQLRAISGAELPKLITGHIDLLQVRNGQIHILDYKPKAAKEKPIEQLTMYALALSRLTGLRVYDFKCAWFDEKDYFEFFPLHAVRKSNRKFKRKTVRTKEGIYQVNQNKTQIELTKR